MTQRPSKEELEQWREWTDKEFVIASGKSRRLIAEIDHLTAELKEAKDDRDHFCNRCDEIHKLFMEQYQKNMDAKERERQAFVAGMRRDGVVDPVYFKDCWRDYLAEREKKEGQ